LAIEAREVKQSSWDKVVARSVFKDLLG